MSLSRSELRALPVGSVLFNARYSGYFKKSARESRRTSDHGDGYAIYVFDETKDDSWDFPILGNDGWCKLGSTPSIREGAEA